MDITMHDACWGVTFGSIHRERKGKKQNWEAGEVELHCSLNGDLSQSGSSEAENTL